MQEYTTVELDLLQGELNKQIARISEVQDSMTIKIPGVEETMSN